MILDNERQRELLIGAIRATTWQGTMLEEGARLVLAVKLAPVAERPDKNLAPPPETA